MADNKADALKEAKNQYQLKVYYAGPTPEDESGDITFFSEKLNNKFRPWLIKFYLKDKACYQYANTMVIYRQISKEIGEVLDAVIVNNKQRDAVDKIIGKVLLDCLGFDSAGEKDSIIDPCEY